MHCSLLLIVTLACASDPGRPLHDPQPTVTAGTELLKGRHAPIPAAGLGIQLTLWTSSGRASGGALKTRISESAAGWGICPSNLVREIVSSGRTRGSGGRPGRRRARAACAVAASTAASSEWSAWSGRDHPFEERGVVGGGGVVGTGGESAPAGSSCASCRSNRWNSPWSITTTKYLDILSKKLEQYIEIFFQVFKFFGGS